MALSSRRETVLVEALAQEGWTITARTTLIMMGGDVVETSVWMLRGPSGEAKTLTIVTELGMGGLFPPILRVVDGDLDAEAARSAPGTELAWEDGDPVLIRRFVAEVTRARIPP